MKSNLKELSDLDLNQINGGNGTFSQLASTLYIIDPQIIRGSYHDDPPGPMPQNPTF